MSGSAFFWGATPHVGHSTAAQPALPCRNGLPRLLTSRRFLHATKSSQPGLQPTL